IADDGDDDLPSGAVEDAGGRSLGGVEGDGSTGNASALQQVDLLAVGATQMAGAASNQMQAVHGVGSRLTAQEVPVVHAHPSDAQKRVAMIEGLSPRRQRRTSRAERADH